MVNIDYLKNPFNYIGGKYKLLPQILPLFPKKIDKFVDLFGGGGEVSLNVNAKQVVYNDKRKPLVNIFRNLDSKFVDEVKEMIDTYKLNKFSKQEFLNLRSYYNTNLKDKLDRENAVVLYCLITHAFNYQIAFNKNREFNMPSGASRSYFSKSLEDKLVKYIEAIDKKNISFYSSDFHNLNLDSPEFNNTFYYCDPPYLITVGGYERDYFVNGQKIMRESFLIYLTLLTQKVANLLCRMLQNTKVKKIQFLKSGVRTTTHII